MAIHQVCSVCGTDFEPQFSYQMEERVETDETGRPRARFLHFCSQKCHEKSHHGESDGAVACDACAACFKVELASQVLYLKGRRHYACGTDCRQQLLAESRGVRLGDGLTPAAPDVEAAPLALAASPAVPASPAPTEQTPLPPVVRLGESAPPRHARVLAVFNHKGGTGKTTTSVTLAAGLAEKGHKVLLVDTDGQGNVAVSFGVKPQRTLYHVLVMGLALEQAVTKVRDNLDLLPSNETLAAAELYLAGRKNRDRVLATRLAAAREAYDYVIVDCSPSLSLMNQNALVLADSVLCPVACDYLSLVGVRQVLRTIKQVQKLLSHPVQLWGVLPTLYDSRANICDEALATLRQHFGERCLEPIRIAIKVKEAPAQGRTLFEHAPGSTSALDYEKVVDRLIADTTAATAPQGQHTAAQVAAGGA